MPEYTLKASVDVAVTADTESEARKAAFDLMTSCRQEKRRGRPTGSPVASVTGVTIGCDGKHEAKNAYDVIRDAKGNPQEYSIGRNAEGKMDVTPVQADAMEGSES